MGFSEKTDLHFMFMGYDSYFLTAVGLQFDIFSTYFSDDIIRGTSLYRTSILSDTTVAELFGIYDDSGVLAPSLDRTLIWGYLERSQIDSWRKIYEYIYKLNGERDFSVYYITEESMLYCLMMRGGKFRIHMSKSAPYLTSFYLTGGDERKMDILKVEGVDTYVHLIRAVDQSDESVLSLLCNIDKLVEMIKDPVKSQFISWDVHCS
jgi:hypothetical protein